jgi:hypothetical protein
MLAVKAIFSISFANISFFSFSSAEAWLSDERMIIGTDNGRVLLFDGPDQKAELFLYPEERKVSPPPAAARVECLGAHVRGFVVGDTRGQLHVYERGDEREAYRSTRRELVPADAPQQQQVCLPNPKMALIPLSRFVCLTYIMRVSIFSYGRSSRRCA